MRLAAGDGLQRALGVMPGVPQGAALELERFAELFTQLRSAGYSGDGALEVAQRVLAGDESSPKASVRFARVYGDS